MSKLTEQVVKLSGNQTSVFVFIPKPMREMLGLKKGDYVRLRIVEGTIIIEPLSPQMPFGLGYGE